MANVKFRFTLLAVGDNAFDINAQGALFGRQTICTGWAPAPNGFRVSASIPVSGGDIVNINRAHSIAVVDSRTTPGIPVCKHFENYGTESDIRNSKNNIKVVIPQGSTHMRVGVSSDSDWENLYVSIKRLVNPNYSDELAKETAREINQQFFREKLTADLTFGKSDFRFIHSRPFDTKFQLDIFYSLDNGKTYSDKPYVSSVFFKVDCFFDEDDHLCRVTPTPNDRYDEILGGLDKEFNLIELRPEIERIDITRRSIIQTYRLGSSSMSFFASGTWWEQDAKVVDSVSDIRGLHFGHNASFFEAHITSEHPISGVVPVGTYTGDNQSNLINANNSAVRVEVLLGRSPGLLGTSVGVRIVNIASGQPSFEGSISMPGTLEQNRDRSISVPVPISMTGSPHVTATAHITTHHIYSRLLTARETSQTHPIPQDDIVARNPNYGFVEPISGGLPSVRINGSASFRQTEWGVREDGRYYERPQFNRLMPLARSNWMWASLWVSIPSEVINWSTSDFVFELRDSRPLHSAINVLLREIIGENTPITFSNTPEHSEVLYGNAMGNMENRGAFITQKTNILNSNHDQPAQRANIKLRSILDMLRNTMQLYWFLDGNRFRIEHISYFKNGMSYGGVPQVGLDLNELYKTRIPKKWGHLKNKFDFDKTDIPSRIQFNWADTSSVIFAGDPIEPISNFVQRGRVEDIHIRGFSADIDLMLSNPQEFSNDGFAVMIAERRGNRNVLPFDVISRSDADFWNPIEPTDNHEAQNPYMSFRYLHSQFWLHDLPTKNVLINRQMVEAKSVMQIKKQDVDFPFIGAFENKDVAKELVRTGLKDKEGNYLAGRVHKLNENLSSLFSKVELRYDAE